MTTNPYHPDLYAFLDDLRKEIEEESGTYDKYMELAKRADRIGSPTSADTLRSIARDEQRHGVALEIIVKRLEKQEVEGQPVYSSHYSFPATYGDWVNLGSDIKTKDPGAIDLVNRALSNILDETSNAYESKRELVRKAGELGIT